MTSGKTTTGLLVQIDQLHENIEMVESVLDGTYGDSKGEEGDVRQTPRMEDRLEELNNGLEKAIAKIQGLGERLQRMMAQL